MSMRKMCKSKIYGLKVTNKKIEYEEGSITLPKKIMQTADILPGEIVLIINTNNGERFETYVIEGEEGKCELLGGAARLAEIGDKLLIISYKFINDESAKFFSAKIVKLGENNNLL